MTMAAGTATDMGMGTAEATGTTEVLVVGQELQITTQASTGPASSLWVSVFLIWTGFAVLSTPHADYDRA